MSRESTIAAALRARLTKKKDDLRVIDDDLDRVQQKAAELTVRRMGIVAGIDEDEALLKRCAPKTPRTKKTGRVENIGNQLSPEKV